tara:strand:- start:505 stop:714 length:210 start_codon:yes stop_codon:yes gene_type:complete
MEYKGKIGVSPRLGLAVLGHATNHGQSKPTRSDLELQEKLSRETQDKYEKLICSRDAEAVKALYKKDED